MLVSDLWSGSAHFTISSHITSYHILYQVNLLQSLLDACHIGLQSPQLCRPPGGGSGSSRGGGSLGRAWLLDTLAAL